MPNTYHRYDPLLPLNRREQQNVVNTAARWIPRVISAAKVAGTAWDGYVANRLAFDKGAMPKRARQSTISYPQKRIRGRTDWGAYPAAYSYRPDLGVFPAGHPRPATPYAGFGSVVRRRRRTRSRKPKRVPRRRRRRKSRKLHPGTFH